MYESEFITNINGKERRKTGDVLAKTTPHTHTRVSIPISNPCSPRPLMCLRPRVRPLEEHEAWRRGFAGKRASVELAVRLEVGCDRDRAPTCSRGSAITSVPPVAAPSGAPSKPRRGIYPGEDMGGGPAHGATLPVRQGCGGFVNSHVLFCCGYKASLLVRCCGFWYTNPLKSPSELPSWEGQA